MSKLAQHSFEDTTQPAGHSNSIVIRGARTHNLRGLDLDIPRGQLVVLTGVSGSGKSTLAFDTIFAEGQRKYLASLSPHARRFLRQLQRPDVDLLEGLPPTICVDQHGRTPRRRSTVGSLTEIVDFLRLLYARGGQAHCPDCGRPVSCQSPTQIVDHVLALPDRSKLMILAPMSHAASDSPAAVMEKITEAGFVRARVDGQIVEVSAGEDSVPATAETIEAVVDRIIVKDDIRPRVSDSINLALRHGNHACLISVQQDGQWCDHHFSTRFACPDCDQDFPPLEPRTFNANSPWGACPGCQGLGRIPDTDSGEDSSAEADPAAMPDDGRECPACGGQRLNPFACAVRIEGTSYPDFVSLPITAASQLAENWQEAIAEEQSDPFATPLARHAAEKILPEIITRLRFLEKTGLDYLSLDRPALSLSGGEHQRARLAAGLGSALSGVCYILDEPTVGLHPRDTRRLIECLEELRDRGSTVLVVEHDPDVIVRADRVIELGPGPGAAGGQLVATGSPQEIRDRSDSIIGPFLREPNQAERRPRNVDLDRSLRLTGATRHNLQHVDVSIPLGVLTCVTGVSGSGKSSLLTDTLVPAVRAALQTNQPRNRNTDATTGTENAGHDAASRSFDELRGIEQIDRLVEVDQSPLGRSSLSNPATWSKMWDQIRRLFARTRMARLRGYTAKRFSFNSPAGRCEECRGRGTIRLTMNFLPEMQVPCPRCGGDRFNRQTLAVRYRGASPADVLRMSIGEARDFFSEIAPLHQMLSTFCEVGLDYLSLGQSATTLSGGESQRVKLATSLAQPELGHTLFVLDEPTSGLHPADVERLLDLLHRLVDRGETVVVIEHHLDVIRSADWIIDMGPEGGAGGGRIIATGPPTEIAACSGSHTGRALRSAD